MRSVPLLLSLIACSDALLPSATPAPPPTAAFPTTSSWQPVRGSAWASVRAWWRRWTSVERCDGFDNDRDGLVDEGMPDADADGLADCQDDERCDGVDNDGDGLVDLADPSLLDAVLRFPDVDGDGHGAAGAGALSCAGAGPTLGDDCDDLNPRVAPGLAERCDGVDQDCDGRPDQGLPSCVAGITLPPDPVEVATPVDPGLAPPLADTSAFLFSGAQPVQTGVEDLDPARTGVLSGLVRERDGAPLAAVRVSVQGHPELGQTFSRADGRWDLAIEAGGPLTLVFERTGWLTSARGVAPDAGTWGNVPEVLLVPLDVEGDPLLLGVGSPPQVAEGPVQMDQDGARRAMLMLPAGTSATMRVEGVDLPLAGATLRIDEYTVGPSGPAAMPGDLPTGSGYTWAAELSLDEAEAAGASRVDFDRPVALYVDDFLEMPVGTPVPTGWYDREAGAWVPSDDGLVIEVLGVGPDGLAEVDTSGSGTAAAPALLAALGIDEVERANLAVRYPAGGRLWRVRITHLTPWDCNWPYDLPNDARPPVLPPLTPQPVVDPECRTSGGVSPEGQVVQQGIPVAGTGLNLVWSSDRTPAWKADHRVRVPLEQDLPASAAGVEVTIDVGGRPHTWSWAPGDQPTELDWTWDGVDAWGRPSSGCRPAEVRVDHLYRPVYVLPGSQGRNFGAWSQSTEVIGQRTTGAMRMRSRTRTCLGRPPDGGASLDGWSIDQHHSFDPGSGTVTEGDGDRYTPDPSAWILRSFAGNGVRAHGGDGGPAEAASFGWVRGVAVAADGTTYVSDEFYDRVRRIRPDGTIETVVGGLGQGFNGDGLEGRQTKLSNPRGLAVGPDGSLYIADRTNNRVRKVTWQADGSGIVTTVAGNGAFGPTALDRVPATTVPLNWLQDLDVDAQGNLYILEGQDAGFSDRGRYVSRVDRDGVLTRLAGTGRPPFIGQDGDGGPAQVARLYDPLGFDVAEDGTILIADGRYVRRIRPDGRIETLAGKGSISGAPAEGVPATQSRLLPIDDVLADRDGSVWFSDQSHHIWHIDTEGRLIPVAGRWDLGGTNYGAGLDGAPALTVGLSYPGFLARAPDGDVLIGMYGWNGVVRLGPRYDVRVGDDVVLPSRDGQALYRFDPDGVHLATLDPRTGAERWSFTYAEIAGQTRLMEIVDADGGVTAVERDGEGNATAILGADGQETRLERGASGRVERIVGADGGEWQVEHRADGGLGSLTEPGGAVRAWTYDAEGRATGYTGPGGEAAFVRTQLIDGWRSETITALGGSRTWSSHQLPGGGVRVERTDAAGRLTVRERDPSGTTLVRQPDGTALVRTQAPDPRYGMLAMVPAGLSLTTPGGQSWAMQETREAGAGWEERAAVVAGRTWSTRWEGDAQGGQWTRVTPAGRQLVVDVDAVGRPLGLELGGLGPVRWTRDGAGRPVTLEEGEVQTQWTWDTTGLVARTGPDGSVTSWTRDGAGRVLSRTGPDGTLYVTRDAGGRPARLDTPGGRSFAFDWAEDGRPTRVVLPDGATSTWTWNAQGLPEQLVLPGGTTLRWAWSAAGELVWMGAGDDLRTISRDPVSGRPAVLARGGTTVGLAWDGPLPLAESLVAEVSGAVAWTWSDRLLPERITVAGTEIDLTHDADGLLVGAGPLTMLRDDAGLTQGASVGSVEQAQIRDARGQISSLQVDLGGTALYTSTLTRDAAGRVIGEEEVLGGARSRQWSYDAAGRLVEAWQDGALVGFWSYDLDGQRVEADGAAEVVDGRGRVVASAGADWSWDGDGRLVGGPGMALSWDAMGSLQAAELGDTRITWEHDALDRPIARRIDGELDRGWLWGGERLMATLTPEGEVDAVFVYGTWSHVPDLMLRDGQTWRIVTDHRASVRLVVDADTGEIAQRLDYDAWGRVTFDSNPGWQPFGFAGGLYEPEAGLVRFGARVYVPTIGRWASPDSRGLPGDAYVYSGNDPIGRFDPDGEVPITVVIGAIGGGAAGAIDAAQDGDGAWGIAGGLLWGATKGAIGGIPGVGFVSGVGLSGLFNSIDQYAACGDFDAERLAKAVAMDAAFSKLVGFAGEALPPTPYVPQAGEVLESILSAQVDVGRAIAE